jgi:integrase
MSTTKLNGKFQARWRDPDGRQRTKLFPTRREAEDHLATVRVEIRRGAYTGHRPSVTVRAYAEESFLPRLRDLRPNSVERYGYAVSKHIVPKLGGRKVGSLTTVDVERFVGALTRTLAPSTVATVHAVLHAMLRDAAKEGLLASNPATGSRLPRIERHALELLSAEQVLVLAEAITPRYQVAVWLAAGAGLREGEALGLRRDRIDFLRRRVHVLEQMQNRQLVELKTSASRRVVPVDDIVLEKVSEHIGSFPAAASDLLITNKDGRPVQRNSFGWCWRAAVQAAGLPPGTRFHGLRHWYACTLIADGLHPKTIQIRLGHATISETLDTYGAMFRDPEEQGRGAIEAAFTSETERQHNERNG